MPFLANAALAAISVLVGMLEFAGTRTGGDRGRRDLDLPVDLLGVLRAGFAFAARCLRASRLGRAAATARFARATTGSGFNAVRFLLVLLAIVRCSPCRSTNIPC